MNTSDRVQGARSSGTGTRWSKSDVRNPRPERNPISEIRRANVRVNTWDIRASNFGFLSEFGVRTLPDEEAADGETTPRRLLHGLRFPARSLLSCPWERSNLEQT